MIWAFRAIGTIWYWDSLIQSCWWSRGNLKIKYYLFNQNEIFIFELNHLLILASQWRTALEISLLDLAILWYWIFDIVWICWNESIFRRLLIQWRAYYCQFIISKVLFKNVLMMVDMSLMKYWDILAVAITSGFIWYRIILNIQSF